MNKYNDRGYRTYRLYGSAFIVAAFVFAVFVIVLLSTMRVEHVYVDDIPPSPSGLNNPTDPVVSDMLRNKFNHLSGKRLVLVNSVEEAKKIRDELPYIDKFYIKRDIISRSVFIQYTLKGFYGSYQDDKTHMMYLLGNDGILYPVYSLTRYEMMKGKCFVINRGAGDNEVSLLLKELVRSAIPDGAVVYSDKNTFDVSCNGIRYKMGLYKDFSQKLSRLYSLSVYLPQHYDPATIEYVTLASHEFPAIKFIK